MEELLKQLVEGQKQLFEGQKRIEVRLDSMDGRLDSMEGRLDSMEGRLDNVEGRLTENTEYVKALLHQSEYQKAQIEVLVHTTSRIEGEVKNIRADLGAVEAITAKNWNDIIQLKVAK